MSAPTKTQLLEKCSEPTTCAEITRWSNENKWVYKRTRETIEDLISAGYLKRIPQGVVDADYVEPTTTAQAEESPVSEPPAPAPEKQASPKRGRGRPPTLKNKTLEQRVVEYLKKCGGQARSSKIGADLGVTQNQISYVRKS